MSVLIPLSPMCRSASDITLTKRDAVTLLAPPPPMGRSVSCPEFEGSLLDIQALLASLCSAAAELDEKVPNHGYITVELIGVHHDAVKTPLHCMIRANSDVQELRTQIGSMLETAFCNIIIFFAGWLLLDGHLLNEYGVVDQSQVVVALLESADERRQPEIVAGPQPPTEKKAPDRGPLIGTKLALGYGRPCIYHRGEVVRVNPEEARLLVVYDNNSRTNEWINLQDRNLKFDEIMCGPNHRQQLLGAWEYHSSQRAWSSMFERVLTQGHDMITLESMEEPLYLMPCGHGITENSLLSFVYHELSEGRSQILCPSMTDGSKCNCEWTLAHLRTVLEQGLDIAKIEVYLSFNAIATRMNAQKCRQCGVILFRDDKGCQQTRATCPNCVRLAKRIDLGDEKENSCDFQFCWICQTPWTNSDAFACDNPTCRSDSQVGRVIEIIRNCDLKTVGRVENVPSVRACVHCGQLITHWSYCKHISCFMCKRSFCFVCLEPYDRQTGWKCGSSGDVCPVGPVQERYVASFGATNKLDLREEMEREQAIRNGCCVGMDVEFYDHSRNAWFGAQVVAIHADGREFLEVAASDGQLLQFGSQSHCVRCVD